jgi:hypothetical protein
VTSVTISTTLLQASIVAVYCIRQSIRFAKATAGRQLPQLNKANSMAGQWHTTHTQCPQDVSTARFTSQRRTVRACTASYQHKTPDVRNSKILMLTVRNSTASYCSDSSRTADLGQQYAVVSEWLATFRIYRHTQHAVCHIRIAWYALYLPKSVYPGLFHPPWDPLCVSILRKLGAISLTLGHLSSCCFQTK